MDEGVANRDTPLVLDEVAVAIQPSQTTLIPNLHNEEHEVEREKTFREFPLINRLLIS